MGGKGGGGGGGGIFCEQHELRGNKKVGLRAAQTAVGGGGGGGGGGGTVNTTFLAAERSDVFRRGPFFLWCCSH